VKGSLYKVNYIQFNNAHQNKVLFQLAVKISLSRLSIFDSLTIDESGTVEPRDRNIFVWSQGALQALGLNLVNTTLRHALSLSKAFICTKFTWPGLSLSWDGTG
jgi:hypothetical protein